MVNVGAETAEQGSWNVAIDPPAEKLVSSGSRALAFNPSGFIFASALSLQSCCCLRVASCARELAAYHLAGTGTLAA